MPNTFKTDLAESTLAQLVLRISDYRLLAEQIVQRSTQTQGRHHHSMAELRSRNVLTDLVATVENFTGGLLLNLRPTVTHDEVGTWDKKRKAWLKHTAVDFRLLPTWTSLLGFVEARNAIQHGLGRLTDRQLGKHRGEVLAAIAATNLRLNGDMVLLTEEDVEECATTCACFVRSLDLAAPAR
jgi:hypothetical protein